MPSKPEKTKFVISKRRGSFHIESSSGTERNSDIEEKMHVSMAKKRPGRNSSEGKTRLPRPQEKNRNLVVIQEQKMFDGELIPQAQMNEAHLMQLPNALRKDRRNDLRSKRRNNPSPLETNFP